MKRPVTLDSPYGVVTLGGNVSHATRISSETPEGAFWALGWWQSSESGAEALFARAFWRAQLSQSPGAHEGHRELDSIVRSWNVDAGLDREVESLTAGDRAALHAFTRGFAAFQTAQRHWPWKRPEFPPAPWMPGDSILLARTLGLASWWETRGALTRELLRWVQAGVSWEKLSELVPELGDEQDRTTWLQCPPIAPWSDAAWSLVHRLHRWRPGVAFTSPLWGATYVCDVTEPGLPFLEVAIDCPGFSCEGLCLPGLPVLVAGRNENVVWHVQPSWGDVFHFSTLGDSDRKGAWVGAHAQAGEDSGSSLGALMAGPSSTSAEALAQAVRGRGAASLTLTALDRKGAGIQVELGSRWRRQHPRDAWLPSVQQPTLSPSVGPAETLIQGPPFGAGPTPSYAQWQALLTGTLDEQVDTLLPELRFLLPETGDAQLLKTWSGTPTDGPQALLFQRLLGAVWKAFWSGADIDLPPDHPATSLLWRKFDALVAAPHSAWLPARLKNGILGAAVRAELERGGMGERGLQRRSSLRALYPEQLGAQRRVMAATVAMTLSWESPHLDLFHTDDETESPAFRPVADTSARNTDTPRSR